MCHDAFMVVVAGGLGEGLDGGVACVSLAEQVALGLGQIGQALGERRPAGIEQGLGCPAHAFAAPRSTRIGALTAGTAGPGHRVVKGRVP